MFPIIFWISVVLAVVGVVLDCCHANVWCNLFFLPVILCILFFILLIWGLLSDGGI